MEGKAQPVVITAAHRDLLLVSVVREAEPLQPRLRRHEGISTAPLHHEHIVDRSASVNVKVVGDTTPGPADTLAALQAGTAGAGHLETTTSAAP